MQSPEVWSATSTLVDHPFASRHSSLAADLYGRELLAKENLSKEDLVSEKFRQLFYLNEKPLPPPQDATVDIQPPPPAVDVQLSAPALADARPAPSPIQPLGTADDSTASVAPTRSKSEVVGSKLKHAYGEVRHFAGGLVTHPHESTKHYSVIRHSHGFLYYSGHYTSLAVSVFADRELPPDRSFWLQRKGFSGNTGLKIGALMGARSGWVDVTPKVQATPDQVKPVDERAYKRDIDRFRRKATKKTASHMPKETCILRIPCEAYDGYLRVVMCTGENGKKTLCSSPLFRLFSTSTESSSIRGASLKTLPIEVGIKLGSIVANNAARAAVVATTGPYVATANSFIGGQVSRVFQPVGFFQEKVTEMACEKVADAAENKMGELDSQVADARNSSHQMLPDGTQELMIEPTVIGEDAGPQKPYPVRFHGKVAAGTGKDTSTLGAPTANLINVDSDISLRYIGVYFGWAAVHLPKKMQEELLIDDDWHEAIIYVIPRADVSASTVQEKTVKVHILQDFDNTKFFDVKVSVIMMGFLRLVDASQHAKDEELEIKHANLLRDTACTTASLARPEWAADTTLARIKSEASDRTLTERYVDMRRSTQTPIEKMPMHKLGVRTDGHSMRDRLIGNGGVWIKR